MKREAGGWDQPAEKKPVMHYCIFELLSKSPQMQMRINEHTEITSNFLTIFCVLIIGIHLLKQK